MACLIGASLVTESRLPDGEKTTELLTEGCVESGLLITKTGLHTTHLSTIRNTELKEQLTRAEGGLVKRTQPRLGLI